MISPCRHTNPAHHENKAASLIKTPTDKHGTNLTNP